MAAAMSGAVQSFIQAIPDKDIQGAMMAVLNGNTSGYLTYAASQLQKNGVVAHNDVSEARLGTGGLAANHGSDLDRYAPQRPKDTFNPGVPTQRGLPA